MFDEPAERPQDHALDPAQRAKDKADEFRIHAELCAIFEAPRKFEADLRPDLDPTLARDFQKRIGLLEKAKSPETPILPQPSAPEAIALLNLPNARNLSTNDYHIHRRPGEVMIVRWLQAEQVDTFYERMQAHFDVALEQFKEDERQANEWKQDSKTQSYLAALDAIDLKVADRYLRDVIRQHKLFVLSTLMVDEMDILHLCDYMMGAPAEDLVGPASAPPSEPTEQDRAWFFKLFSLRGLHEGVERMCFFVYMQKTDDSSW